MTSGSPYRRHERAVVWTVAVVGCLIFWALIGWLAYTLTTWAVGDTASGFADSFGYWGP